MISMTGYGEASAEAEGVRFDVRIVGVNHRHLEVVLRAPEEIRFADAAIRQRIAAGVRRGRCEMTLGFQRIAGPGGRARVEIDHGAVAELHREAQPLADGGLVRLDLSLGDLLRQPALVRIEAGRPGDSSRSEALLLQTVERALEGFRESRASEGAKLRGQLTTIAGELADTVEVLRALVPAATEKQTKTLRERFLALGTEPQWTEDRWLQEAALLAEKSDVREEVERLAAHLEALRSLLEADSEGERGEGRRLDFLAQELLRELNTLAAKCRDVEVVRTSLEARLLCEQIREQAQNVE